MESTKIKYSLLSYIESFRPIIYINHHDHVEVIDTIRTLDTNVQCLVFDNAQGLGIYSHESPFPRYIDSSETLYSFLDKVKDDAYGMETYLILKDINDLLSGPNKDLKVLSILKYISERTLYANDYHATIFILSDMLVIPHELENYITIFDYPLPIEKEIYILVKDFAKEMHINVSDDIIDSIVLSLKGMTKFQITQILNLAYHNGGNLVKEDTSLILKEKEQFIKKTGMLEIIPVKEKPEDIGGLEIMKDWLNQKANIFKNLDKAIRFGVDLPKGILIMGRPGCGKSLTAKTTAAMFNLPLIRLDVGRLLGKYVGESEENMRKALKLSEAISPCVLWIDELEKAFAGVTSNNDGGITFRLFGQFLTWMQEKTSSVFIVATANNIKSLPKEFFRKGRFDELFYVDCPNKAERIKIFNIHLKKRKKWNKNIDVEKLAKETENFSGADIETIVKNAVEVEFLRGLKENLDLSAIKLDTSTILDAIKGIKPFNNKEEQKDIKSLIDEYGFKYASK
ncbi:MAG: AAA family ATPase [Bacteroidales bacterium]|nr:AAA family ATPase [Bacteroidales bacterium]